MKTNNPVLILVAAVMTCVALFSYCHFNGQSPLSEPVLQDTIFLSQWRKEKAEKLKIIDSCTYEIQKLAQSKDSLKFCLALNKDLLMAYRLKSKDLKAQLQTEILKDTSKSRYAEIRPVIGSLIEFVQLSDSACDLTITTLESSVANRDSTIRFYIGIETGLRDLQNKEELNNQFLTQQLTLALKIQKKKTRQNKILSSSLLILSGITTALLISQNNR